MNVHTQTAYCDMRGWR